jgi:alkylated DNA repair dioxygenase AlkB
MNFDLFAPASAPEHLKLVDAEIDFMRHVELPRPADELLRELIDQTPWRSETITIYGKQVAQPRLSAWYGDPEANYSYSGIKLEPMPWTSTLIEIKNVVQKLSGESFNSVLLNYYRNHRDSMGLHSDDESELGPTPSIASLSLGATRTFILKHKIRRELKPVRLELTSGCLLVMKGRTQTFWKHGIDKQAIPCGARVNLTFRRIVGT